MSIDLSKAEIALIQRAASYLLMGGRMAKAEKPVANELLKKLGVGFLPAIQRVVDHAPALEEHVVKSEAPKAEGRSGTPHSALRTPQSP